MKNNVRIIVMICLICLVVISGIKYNKNLKESSLKLQEASIEEKSKEEIIKYDISTYITPEMKKNAKKMTRIVCFANEYTPEFLMETCDAIAIIRVISHDKVDAERGLFEFTIGKALVNNRIYGNLEEDSVITYIKPGAYIDMETWNNAQPEAARDNRIRVREEMGINTPLSEEYINTLLPDDIDIDIGKTYLAYLHYNEENNEYEIIGLGNGLREVDVNQETKYVSKIDIDLDDAQILNNVTNEYESLKEYIDKYIKIYE